MGLAREYRQLLRRVDELQRQARRMWVRRPAGSGNSDPSTIAITVTQTAHGYAAGQVVYFDAILGSWQLSSASSYSTAVAAGIISAAETDSFTLVLAGLIELAGLATGVHYVSDSTPGSRTQSPTGLELPCLIGIGSGKGVVIPRIATGSFGALDIHGTLTIHDQGTSDAVEQVNGSVTWRQYIDGTGKYIIEYDDGTATEVASYDQGTNTLSFSATLDAQFQTIRAQGLELHASYPTLSTPPDAEISPLGGTDLGISIDVAGNKHETIGRDSGGNQIWGIFGASSTKQSVTNLAALTVAGTADNSYNATERDMLNDLVADANAIHTTLDELATALAAHGVVNLT